MLYLRATTNLEGGWIQIFLVVTVTTASTTCLHPRRCRATIPTGASFVGTCSFATVHVNICQWSFHSAHPVKLVRPTESAPRLSLKVACGPGLAFPRVYFAMLTEAPFWCCPVKIVLMQFFQLSSRVRFSVSILWNQEKQSNN